MTASRGERILAAELLVSFVSVWLGAVVRSGQAPAPRQVLGVPILFAALALAATAGGEDVSRLVAALGGLVTLTVVFKAIGSAPPGQGSALTALSKAASGTANVAGGVLA